MIKDERWMFWLDRNDRIKEFGKDFDFEVMRYRDCTMLIDRFNQLLYEMKIEFRNNSIILHNNYIGFLLSLRIKIQKKNKKRYLL